jgi:ParB-like chromosome segregation protein Spo0J
MQFHPIADAFPLIQGAEFDELVEDIRQFGLREPIVLLDGQILDGRNRWRACQAAGVEPRYETFPGGDPIAFAISANLRRRHMDESQRAMVAAKLANMRQGERTDLASFEARLVSQSDAANLLNVSRSSVQRAREVLDHAVPELSSQVERGEVSVSVAADIASLPEPEQQEIVARGEKEIMAAAQRIRRNREEVKRAKKLEENRAAAASIPAVGERYRLFHAPCIEALELEPESVDWVVTDPPYPAEFLSCFSDLGRVAAHVLKPGGGALVMSGQAHLPHVIRHLDEHLHYQWTLAYRLEGDSSRLFGVKVFNRWKPVLLYRKGKQAGEWFDDMVASDVNDNDKEHHHWGQSVSGMRDLMKRFVRPGDVVLDPFLGGGTTAVVALELGATVIGYDIDVNAITATKARIGAMLALQDASMAEAAD